MTWSASRVDVLVVVEVEEVVVVASVTPSGRETMTFIRILF
jgi:hypothetical protein